MPYGKIDDDLHSHPKFQVVGPVVSWACIRAISWSNAHGTDGFIPDAVASNLLPKKADREKASTPQLPGKSPLWDRVEGGFMIHDFLDGKRNQTAAWWEELAAKRRSSGQAGGVAKAVANDLANAKQNPKQNPKQNTYPVNPVPRTPLPVSEETGLTPWSTLTPSTRARADLIAAAVGKVMARELRPKEYAMMPSWAELRRNGELVAVEEILAVVRTEMSRETPEGGRAATLHWCRDSVLALAREVGPPSNAVDRQVLALLGGAA